MSESLDVEHLERQRAWSEATFGPGTREKGVCDHIAKELIEVRDAETVEEKRKEWIDVVILALDGAWRSGMTPEQIVAAVKAKQARNEARTWPDWRTADPDKAIEHDRSADPCGAYSRGTDGWACAATGPHDQHRNAAGDFTWGDA